MKNYFETKEEKLEALVDTGYDGDIVIPFSIYQKLQLSQHEYPDDQMGLIETASGELISLKSASAIIEFVEIEISIVVIVDTFTRGSEIIIGRKLLESFRTILDGSDKKIMLEFSS
ncbi:MAG: hypothetical protein GPJ54_04750 [Candidatus Heimdallarchaeota archaeon]|nr:hypothetical protein [Candidatus Heimdallarchaeota archaeon]